MDQKPDFKKVYILANEMLTAAHCIASFPFNAQELIKEQTDLMFCSFEKARKKINLNCRDLGSGSAVLANLGGKHILFYNQDEYDARAPFNALHETAHFLLRHKTNLGENNPLYQMQEVEANFFAAQMLMPLQVLREIQRRLYKVDVQFLVTQFGVSRLAAERRIKTLKSFKDQFILSWEERMFDDIILGKFKAFIDRIAPERLADTVSCWDDRMQETRNSWIW